ncbi:LOW QUALITY PROTEIN: nascent polypeptide-associated complex subunit alpha, muscle-specific form-like, partial [Anser cygnoides]|uniref:LOW QUALITY PROTEIN: nascent polypeptide-associated complex subunit alpha, muscle-specific form-like n=1 Tax=Anser cygnoides TaxID=8845 RepID=UPI0034D25AAC
LTAGHPVSRYWARPPPVPPALPPLLQATEPRKQHRRRPGAPQSVPVPPGEQGKVPEEPGAAVTPPAAGAPPCRTPVSPPPCTPPQLPSPALGVPFPYRIPRGRRFLAPCCPPGASCPSGVPCSGGGREAQEAQGSVWALRDLSSPPPRCPGDAAGASSGAAELPGDVNVPARCWPGRVRALVSLKTERKGRSEGYIRRGGPAGVLRPSCPPPEGPCPARAAAGAALTSVAGAGEAPPRAAAPSGGCSRPPAVLHLPGYALRAAGTPGPARGPPVVPGPRSPRLGFARSRGVAAAAPPPSPPHSPHGPGAGLQLPAALRAGPRGGFPVNRGSELGPDPGAGSFLPPRITRRRRRRKVRAPAVPLPPPPALSHCRRRAHSSALLHSRRAPQQPFGGSWGRSEPAVEGGGRGHGRRRPAPDGPEGHHVRRGGSPACPRPEPAPLPPAERGAQGRP